MRFPSRRWGLWLSAALLLVGAVALGCALAQAPSRGVTEANCDRIQDGMTPEQVDGILGAENIYYRGSTPRGMFTIYQEGDDGRQISVGFIGGRVRGKMVFLGEPQTLGDFLRDRLTKVRRRLGL